jgi:hypothetical protein
MVSAPQAWYVRAGPEQTRERLNDTRSAQPGHTVETLHFFRCACGALVDKRKLEDVFEHLAHSIAGT